MCDKRNWCIVNGKCSVHNKWPHVGPLQPGPVTPDPSCSLEEIEYLRQATCDPVRETNRDQVSP